jgi:hypothetical protein
MDEVPNRHNFCIFENGAEKIVSLTDGEYYLHGVPPVDEYDLLIPSYDAFRLHRLQQRYLQEKKQQQAQKNVEALCFKFCAKHLPLTRDVVNFICNMITSRPFDPNLIKNE